MIIRKYGIVLRRLKIGDIELLREKRNQDSVRNYMFYKNIISKEEQKEWFYSINNKLNYYFIIEYEDKKIGLINGKNIDYDKRTSEGGIFIWDENYRNIEISAIASVIMAEFTFMVLMFNKTFAEVLASNNAQVKYNEFMGYELVQKQGDKLTYVLTKESYIKKRVRLLKAIQHLTKDKKQITWQDIDLSKVLKEERTNLYSGLPDYVQEGLNKLFH